MAEQLIEVKHSDKNISRPLRYYAERLNPEKAVQIVAVAKRPYDRNRLRVTGPLDYFQPPW